MLAVLGCYPRTAKELKAIGKQERKRARRWTAITEHPPQQKHA